MHVFHTWCDLITSNVWDRWALKSIFSTYFLHSAILMYPMSSILYFAMMFSKAYLESFQMRLSVVLGFVTVAYSLGMWYSLFLVVVETLVRCAVVFLPMTLSKLPLRRDHVAETALRRLSRTAYTFQSPRHGLDQCVEIYLNFQRGDQSEALTDEEFTTVQSFLTDLPFTCTCLGFDGPFWNPRLTEACVLFSGIILSYPNVKVRWGSTRPVPRMKDLCPVCRDHPEGGVELSCKHQFCVACIGTWLDQHSTCPVCRKEI